jgi:hypothetical protein
MEDEEIRASIAAVRNAKITLETVTSAADKAQAVMIEWRNCEYAAQEALLEAVRVRDALINRKEKV